MYNYLISATYTYHQAIATVAVTNQISLLLQYKVAKGDNKSKGTIT